MASLRELKKQLESVRMTGQMAGAMKTASAVKFARISGVLTGYEAYASVCRNLRTRFGRTLSEALPQKNPEAPRCFVLLGSNRGLSGGYNGGLYEFADRILAEADAAGTGDTGGYRLIVVGKHAANRFREQSAPDVKSRIIREFTLPDIPSDEDAAPVLACALELYGAGEVSTVEVIWQEFVNMLTQEPAHRVLLPLGTDGGGQVPSESLRGEEPLYVPDRDTVLKASADACVSADFYARILEAAAGAQAATLVAMRTASDNADKNAAALEADISHRRQSEVTSGVIETAGGNAAKRPE